MCFALCHLVTLPYPVLSYHVLSSILSLHCTILSCTLLSCPASLLPSFHPLSSVPPILDLHYFISHLSALISIYPLPCSLPSPLQGIGKSRAATTRPVMHHGRYSDRALKVSDSCYALCPPSNMMRYS